MLKVGLFGVGHLGKFHLNNWKEIEGIKLIGFFDPNNENAKEVTEKHDLKRFMDEEKLIDACDIIDVITPTNQHFDICMQAIRKGKHVFVEKPITHTIQEGRDLMNLVKEANVKLQVGHVERFNPAYLAIKDMRLNPMFIEVHRLAQFNPRGTEVSVILA
jgi:predicted dehydrogenase